MLPQTVAWLAWLLFGLYMASATFGSILYVLNRSYERTFVGDIANALVYAAFATMGFLIAKRRPGNAIGWLFGATYPDYSAGGLLRGPPAPQFPEVPRVTVWKSGRGKPRP